MFIPSHITSYPSFSLFLSLAYFFFLSAFLMYCLQPSPSLSDSTSYFTCPYLVRFSSLFFSPYCALLLKVSLVSFVSRPLILSYLLYFSSSFNWTMSGVCLCLTFIWVSNLTLFILLIILVLTKTNPPFLCRDKSSNLLLLLHSSFPQHPFLIPLPLPPFLQCTSTLFFLFLPLVIFQCLTCN